MRARANRYFHRLCSVTGEKDPSAALATFVSSNRAPNESLDALARRLGVTRIIEESLAYDGGLFRLSHGELVIKLNAESPFVRRRFTLAHEIGHLLLGKPGLRSSCGDDPDLERACDSIAAELLMPTEDTTAFVSNLGRPSPDKLNTIASNYAVSVHAAAVRVHAGLGLWRCFIGFWERRPETKTLWFVGRRLWDRIEPDSSALDSALSSDGPVQSREVWQRGTNPAPVWLNLLRIDDGRVLGLVDFVH